ncbi:MAG: hypothetical protein EBZ36_08960, partial [Acidobacteria bacterium]|nr:hypothetical protein [Acidobacteriota bacterium]
RITTQPLPYRSGDEATALESVYKLFGMTREIIKKQSGCTHFAGLTVYVLNSHVRPFTAKWHKKSVDGRLSGLDDKYEFRQELEKVQKDLREFTTLLGILAGDLDEIARYEGKAPSESDDKKEDPLGEAIEFGIVDPALKGLNEAELQDISARREHYQINTEKGVNAVGLAISGGGIRSATFALGVVTQLARKGILKQVDFLSTVSGGGYLGSFISSFLSSGKNGAMERLFGKEGELESPALRHLRNHSKYLIEGGAMTFARMIGLVLFGIFASVLLLTPLLLSGALLTALLTKYCFKEAFTQPGPIFPPSPLTICFLGFTVFLVFLLIVFNRVQRMLTDNRDRFLQMNKLQNRIETTAVLFLCVSAFVFFLELLPQLLQLMKGIGGPRKVFLVVATLPVILGVAGLWIGAERLAGRLLFDLFILIGPVLLLTGYLWLTNHFVFNESTLTVQLFVLGMTIALLFFSIFVLDINYASPHRYYRSRLCRSYLVEEKDASGSVESRDRLSLSALDQQTAPYHLINCAVNVPASKNPDLRGRRSDLFLFSRNYCGSRLTGYYPTKEWESQDGHLDLGTAMAISGAAAAPNMGTLTSPRYTFLLAVLNIRLGYWLRTPRQTFCGLSTLLGFPGLLYYFRELTRRMSEKTLSQNLSDGGHIENLGVYELLRRRCKYIIAIDGEADPEHTFGGLLNLTRMARIDLGVEIKPSLAELRLDEKRLTKAHFSLSKIDYQGGEKGLLLYIKSSMTGNEEEFLKKFRADNPAFPHQSTADQIFSEEQFEAYRALGEHIGHDLFKKGLIKEPEATDSVEHWFRDLAGKLLD